MSAMIGTFLLCFVLLAMGFVLGWASRIYYKEKIKPRETFMLLPFDENSQGRAWYRENEYHFTVDGERGSCNLN